MSSGASTSDPIANAVALGRRVFEQARARFVALSKPMRVMLVSTLVAAVVAVAYVGHLSSATTYGTLFANLEQDDAAAIVAKLKEMKVPYRLEGEGGTISVPEANVRELRLELAGAGLPRGGGVGFESFDKLRLGATEFEQRVLYRRALEGELTRTIDTISVVQSSRVHLVLPQRSVFVGREEQASASVVLKLRSGRNMGASEVAGIVHLVASSVSGLTPENVTVVTTSGTVLHKPRATGEMDTGSDETTSARTLESNLEDRVRAMLEKMYGPGHVDVRVSAEIDRSRIERFEDHYDPKNSTIRSEQSTIERSAPDNSMTGVPGAESNTSAPKPVASGQPAAPLRESHTRNFELDHVTEKRLLVAGSLRRLTVAVAVDRRGNPEPPKEELARLTQLVRNAVGADERRGDAVTVDAVPFLEAEPTPTTPPTGLEPYHKLLPYLPHAGAGLGALVLAATVMTIRAARKKRALAAKKAEEASALAALVVAPTENEKNEPDFEIRDLSTEELRVRAHDRATEDPATAALVLRFWLGDGDVRAESASPASKKNVADGILVA